MAATAQHLLPVAAIAFPESELSRNWIRCNRCRA